MSRRVRLSLFAVSLVGFAAFFAAGARGLRPVGRYAGPYGDVLNAISVPERHATDVVTAINFDFRGFDTLGSVMGVLLILRQQHDERRKENPEEDPNGPPAASDAMRAFTLALVGPTVIFGLYIVCHGQLTPGGGFQGGLILATAPLMVYLSGKLDEFKAVTSPRLMEIAEAAGAGGFALAGLAGLAVGKNFLANILPLGKTGTVFSSGTIFLISILTGLEVAAGIVLAMQSFLEHALEIRQRGRSG
jgi:multicomponent Na+:H+ antiporter subunit B